MKLKIFKFAKFFILFIAILAIIITFSLPSNLQTINIAGSSSVFPLIREYSSIYKDYDIVVQAGGSGVGVKSIILNSKEMGMASKKPFSDSQIQNYQQNNFQFENDELDNWKKYNTKTVTIAWDGIGIVYQSHSKKDLVINQYNINKIHELFSGVKKYQYQDLGLDDDFSEIVPFARAGGANISGTADAFLNDSGFYKQLLTLDQDAKDILTNGNYKDNVKTTAEANIEAWNFYKASKSFGKMIYLSAGFINNYENEIKASGYKIAKYQFSDNDQIVLPNEQTISQGYNWYRPINIIFRLNENYQAQQKLISFANWMLMIDNNFNITINHEIEKILKKVGFIKLTPTQIRSMAKNNQLKNIWKTADFDLGYCGAK